LDDRFVNVTGDTMTGDLNLGSNDLLLSKIGDHGFSFSQYGWNSLQLMNTAKTDLRGLRLDFLILGKATSRIELADGTVLARPATPNDAYIWYMDSSTGAAYVHVVKITGGNFEILRAGDITLLTGKTLNLFSGNIYLPAAVTAVQNAFGYDETNSRFIVYNSDNSRFEYAATTP